MLHILANFKKISCQEEFLELELNCFEDIIKSDELYVENEDQVFQSIIEWCFQQDLDYSERENQLKFPVMCRRK